MLINSAGDGPGFHGNASECASVSPKAEGLGVEEGLKVFPEKRGWWRGGVFVVCLPLCSAPDM